MDKVNIKKTNWFCEALRNWEWGWEAWPNLKGSYAYRLLGVKELSANELESKFSLQSLHESANDADSCLVLDGQRWVMLDCDCDTVWGYKYKRLWDHLQSVKRVVEIEKIVAKWIFEFVSVFFVFEESFFYERFKLSWFKVSVADDLILEYIFVKIYLEIVSV